MGYAKTIDEFFGENKVRKEELDKLREILLDFPFEESIKWGMPSYGFGKKNLVGIGSFANWSCLWFHQGCFLQDKAKVLVNAQEGKTSGMRQWRFNNLNEINVPLICEYLNETIENHGEGKEIVITTKKSKDVEMPKLLINHFTSNPKLKNLFDAYSVAQQNEFKNYVNEAKRETTKQQRVEKIEELMLKGKKLNSLWGG